MTRTPSRPVPEAAARDARELIQRLGVRRRGILLRSPTGTGKSTKLKAMLADASLWAAFPRVVLLADSHRTLNEYAEVLDMLPADVRSAVVTLQARPAKQCGPLNRRWQDMEQRGCSALARNTLCSRCRRSSRCAWLKQGQPSVLRDARLIIGTVDYLWLYPALLAEAGDETLFLLDEARLVGRTSRQVLLKGDLLHLAEAAEQVAAGNGEGDDAGVLAAVQASVQYLLGGGALPNMLRPPVVPASISLALQEVGVAQNGRRYRHVVQSLAGLWRSEACWYTEAGDIGYVQALDLAGHPYLLASATLPIVLARRKLRDPELELFEDDVPIHPGTRIFNIANAMGARRNFPGNQERILDFFARLTARDLQEGRRVLLVVKKDFHQDCKAGIVTRLKKLLGSRVHVFSPAPRTRSLPGGTRVAMITYGHAGTNLYEDFDCCYCLSSFNVGDDDINGFLSEWLPGEELPRFRIQYDEHGKRRVVGGDPREIDLWNLAQAALEYLEVGTVLQAVGRCRYHIKPRVVVLMQMTDVGLDGVMEFRTLEEARRHFEVPSERAARPGRGEVVAHLLAQGQDLDAIARTIGVKTSSVARYLRRRKADTKPVRNISALPSAHDVDGDVHGRRG